MKVFGQAANTRQQCDYKELWSIRKGWREGGKVW
jgi:hypothetical protein